MVFTRAQPFAPSERGSRRGQTAVELLFILLGSFIFILLITLVLRNTVINQASQQVNQTGAQAGGFNKILTTGNEACALTVNTSVFANSGGSFSITASYSNLAPASNQVTVTCGTIGTATASGCATSVSGYEQSCTTSCVAPANAGVDPVNYQISATIGSTVCRKAEVLVAPLAVCAQVDTSCGATGACVDCTATYSCYNSTYRTNAGTCFRSACAYAGAVACPTGYACYGNVCQVPVAPPTVELNAPVDGASAASNTYETFTYTPTDDFGFTNASIWTNFTGAWAYSGLNASAIYNASQNSISILVPDGKTSYQWTAQVCDINGTTPSCVFNDTNRTITVDLKDSYANVSALAGVQYHPDVAYDSVDDSFLVFYASNQSDTSTNGNTFELYAARHSPLDASQLATPTALTSGSTHDKGSVLAAAYSPGTNVGLVVYTANHTYGNSLVAIAVNGADASVRVTENTIQTGVSVDIPTEFNAAGDSVRDEFGVLWTDNSSSNLYHGYLSTLAAGSLVVNVNKAQVATGNGSSGVNPKGLAYANASGEYLAVWKQPMGGASPAISVRRVTASSGALAGSQVNVQTDSSNMADALAVTYNYKRNEYALIVYNSTGPWLQRLYGANASPGGIPGVDLGLGGSYGVQSVSYNPWGNEYLVVVTGGLAKRVSDTGSVTSANVTVFPSAVSTPLLVARTAFASSATGTKRNHFVVADSDLNAAPYGACFVTTAYYCANTIGQLVYG